MFLILLLLLLFFRFFLLRLLTFGAFHLVSVAVDSVIEAVLPVAFPAAPLVVFVTSVGHHSVGTGRRGLLSTFVP